MAAPIFQGTGSFLSSTGTVTPTWPSHAQDDIALLFVESANQVISLSTPSGFAEVLNSPQGTGTAAGLASTRLAVYWCRATSGAMAAPIIAASGDHNGGQILTFRGCPVLATALASDSFNRANENPLGAGVWSTVSGLGAMQLVGNTATPVSVSADSASRYSGISWPNDQYSKAKLTVAGGSAGNGVALLVRCAAAAATFYMLAVTHTGTNNVTIYSTVAGVFTQLTGFPVTQAWTDGDTWELRATGTQIQCFLNGAQVGPTVTSSTVTAGSPGIGIGSVITSAAIDDWQGGNPTVPWDVTAGDVLAAASTTVTIPGATTSLADCLIVAACAEATDSATGQFSAWANASLASITQRSNSGTISGNGGGFGVATGVKTAAGVYSATTATLATSSVQGRISLALKPQMFVLGTQPLVVRQGVMRSAVR